MNKFYWFLILFFFPTLLMADTSSLSFAPPLTDYSVIFLGNIFGIVDGVLHGSGSQIMGTMFGVFNAAVLALGGIVIMYTLIVGTMNTANEGQMLGQKWSSIWIPVRSTIGLAFLIPKASGYCLMQIFVMWVVVQGVGAADKIWDAALSYLNRGGVIIKAQIAPAISLSADETKIAQGAAKILSGEVCMVGLQKQLENQRQRYLNDKENGSGPCVNPVGIMESFCNTSVPDFASTVSAVDAQNKASTLAESYEEKMPNFSGTNNVIYQSLNGICGVIKWNRLEINSGANALMTSTERETSSLSRAIGIQQMYMDFLPVATAIVNNDPQINNKLSNNGGAPFSDVAMNQFGVPFLKTGSVCMSRSPDCTSWGTGPGSSNGAIFAGSEFQGAIADYNGIMLPIISLNDQAKTSKSVADVRKFITNAKAEGWMMAGSYFFDLVALNGSATVGANKVDVESGLQSSVFETSTLDNSFGNVCSGEYANLCILFQGNSAPVSQLIALITGSGVNGMSDPLPEPIVDQANPTPTYGGPASSTVNGFIHNSSMLVLPGQAGLVPPKFKFNLDLKAGNSLLNFPKKKFKCSVPFLHCADMYIEDALYNYMFRGIVNIILGFVTDLFDKMILTLLYIPLSQMMYLFTNGIAALQDPGTNPIIALANMGTAFINYSMQLWLDMLAFSLVFVTPWTEALSIIGYLMTPVLGAWIGTMVAIGFTTAYYIPFLPYMIFVFGVIAWLMTVIESMVAGPIVALGVTHPEGDGALGKAEQAIMILMNVFLRPAMMIIGYIAAIALCYVSVWIINAGFAHVISFMIPESGQWSMWQGWGTINYGGAGHDESSKSFVSAGYTGWAGLYASFFSMIMYTMLYMTVVQKAFTLIYVLPDKVLRWIGGQPEQLGAETAQWSEDSKGQMKEGGTDTTKAGMRQSNVLSGGIKEQLAKGASAIKETNVEAQGENNNEGDQ